MQIERLLEMVYLLLDSGGATATELAGRFGVSVRTIYRDVDALSVAGVPVYTARGRGGGIRLLPGYTIDRSMLSADEQKELLYALQGLNATRLPQVEGLLAKVGALFKEQVTASWIEVDFSGWGGGPGEREKFALLKQAILTKRVAGFEYLDSRGRREARLVEPLRLVFKSYAWYMQGYCQTRQACRMFKISRIRGLALAGERFAREIPRDLLADTPHRPAHDDVEVVLRFAPEAAYRVYDDFYEGNIEQNPDGSLTARAQYPYDDWVVGHILSYGEKAEVLGPAWLRRVVADTARGIAALNGGAGEENE